MSKVVLDIENVSKLYRLGQVGAKSMRDDLIRLMSRIRGKEDPFMQTAGENNRSVSSANDYVWALKGINFQVVEGEVLGIIGRNGAGKSTLLKLLSRVTKPTSGSIKIKGRIASLLEVGTGFHPELTGRENVFLNGAILGMTKREIEYKFDEIIDFAGVEKYIDTPTKRYSSGMTVRLGFAVAAHLEPDILIVDEVLAVGDLEFQKKCLGKIRDVSGQGRTVLFVSHNMSAIKSLCNNGILLEHGAIINSGPISQVIDSYFSENRKVSETGVIPSDFFRPRGTGEIKFTSVCTTNLNNEQTKEFHFGEKICVKIGFKVCQSLRNAYITFVIQNAEHEKILFNADYNNGFKGVDLEEGVYEICATLNTHLMPNRFSINAAAADFNSGSAYDYVHNVYEFVVNSIGEGKNNDYPWATVHGYVLGENKWDLKKIK